MKTIEQMSSDIAYSQCKMQGKNPHCKSIDSSNCSTCGVGNPIYMGCIKMVDFAQKWIPVEEELPEIKDKSYQISVKLIPTPQGTVLYRIFTVFNYTSESRLKIELRHYTHWRPIEYE